MKEILTLMEIRRKQGLGQKRVAYNMGISIRLYQYYEHGEMPIPFRRVTPLARALNVSIMDIYHACAKIAAIDAREMR